MILIRIMRSLDRLSSSDQDGDREMYIDLDDASVDSLTGKRTRHHVAEVSHLFSFPFSFPFFLSPSPRRSLSRGAFKVPQAFVPSKKRYSTHIILCYRDRMIRLKFFRHHIFCSSTEFAIDSSRRDASMVSSAMRYTTEINWL